MNTKKLVVRYEYQKYYLPTAKSRRERRTRAEGCAEIDLPMPTKKEFPVAMKVTRGEHVTEIRAYKGKLYIKSAPYAEKTTIYPVYFPRDDRFPAYEEGVSVITKTDEDICRDAAIAKHISKVVFDGFFWECDTMTVPCYCISSDGVDNRGKTTISLCWAWQDYGLKTGDFTFYGTERKEMLSEAKAEAEQLGNTDSLADLGSDINIEVFMPELLPERKKLKKRTYQSSFSVVGFDDRELENALADFRFAQTVKEFPNEITFVEESEDAPLDTYTIDFRWENSERRFERKAFRKDVVLFAFHSLFGKNTDIVSFRKNGFYCPIEDRRVLVHA